MIFEYTYDFGSSTELVLQAICNIQDNIEKSSNEVVKLVARNDPIIFE